ncbi:MAG: hypothetical protein UIH27_00165 [Ruminococcus sp.]|nr:hypothetical protein [Ruminococcus sp.]
MKYSSTELFYTLKRESKKIILITGNNFDFKQALKVLDFHWNSVVCFANADEIKYHMDQLKDYRISNLITADEMPQRKNCMNKKALKIINAEQLNGLPSIKRRQAYNNLFKPLGELIGFDGYVFVDGVTEEQCEELAGFFEYAEHVFFFGIENTGIFEGTDFNCIQESISAFFSSLFADQNDDESYEESSSYNTGLYINEKYYSIPNEELIDVSNVAELLSPEVADMITVPSYLSENYFYNAISNCQNVGVKMLNGAGNDWIAFSNNLTFERTVEKDVYKRIKRGLDYPGSSSRIVNVFGQSFSGKTVLIKRIAYQILKECQYPVIILHPNADFSSEEAFNQSTKQNRKETVCLDALVKLLSQLKNNYGARSFLLVWDLSAYYADTKKYSNLFLNLENRGIHVTMLCSSYINLSETMESDAKYFKSIELKENLDRTEIESLKKLLITKANMPKERCRELLHSSVQGSFLKLIYSLSSTVRPKMRHGVHNEATKTVLEVLQSMSGEYDYTKICDTQISRQFEEAGYKFLSGTSEKEADTKAETMIKIVSFCSKIRIGVPTSLLLRSAGITQMDDILKIMRIPVLAFSYDQNNDSICLFRSEFEAKLVFDYFLNQYKESGRNQTALYIDAFRLLVENFRLNTDNEILALRDFLMRISPNNHDTVLRNEFSRYYQEYIQIMLEDDNIERIKNSPKIVLQLISLIREYYAKMQLKQDPSEETVQLCREMLINAMEFTQSAIDNPRNQDRQLKNKLYTEICQCKLVSFPSASGEHKNLFNLSSNDLDKMFQTMEGVIQSEPTNGYYYTCWEKIAIRYLRTASPDCEQISRIVTEIDRFRQIPSISENQIFVDETAAIYRLISSKKYVGYLQNEMQKGNSAAKYIKGRLELNEYLKKVLKVDYITQVRSLSDEDVESFQGIIKAYLNDDYIDSVRLRLRLKQCMYNRGCWLDYDRERNDKKRGMISLTSEQWADLYQESKSFFMNNVHDYEQSEQARYIYEMYLYAIASIHQRLYVGENRIFDEANKPIALLKNITKYNEYLGFGRMEVKQLICSEDGAPFSFYGSVTDVHLNSCYVRFRDLNNYEIKTRSQNIQGENTEKGKAYQFVIGLSYMGLTCIAKHHVDDMVIEEYQGGYHFGL